MDLSKAHDCLPHDLLLAKMEAYGFSADSLKLIHNYLFGRKQRVKIGSTCSSWQEIKSSVPQRSVLGPFLFNLSINDSSYDMHHSGMWESSRGVEIRRSAQFLVKIRRSGHF